MVKSEEVSADWLVPSRGFAASHDDLAAALAFATSTAVRITHHGGPILQRQIRVSYD